MTPVPTELGTALARAKATVTAEDERTLIVDGLTSAQIGDLAAAAGLAIHELMTVKVSLEDAFMELTQDEVEYRPSSMVGVSQGEAR